MPTPTPEAVLNMTAAYQVMADEAIKEYPTLPVQEACALYMQRMTKADCPHGQTRVGPIVVKNGGETWEYTAEKGFTKRLVKLHPFTGVVGRRLTLSNLMGAQRGNEEATEAFTEKRSKFKAETEVRLGDKNEKKGLARGKRNRDGSKGGTGRNTHGGLTELTKNSDVVKEARKLLAAPGSPPEVVEAGRIAAAQYYVDYLRMMGEIAETLPDLRKELPPTKAIKDALKDAEWLCAKSLEPETKVVAADIEGTSSADNPLSTVTEFGAGQQSLATGGVEPSRMETICDERGGEAGCSAPLRPRQRFQASLALDEALTSTGGSTVLRHAGSDHHAVAALFKLQGKPPPADCDVHAAICVLLGRYTSGRRRAGADTNDGLQTNMETLAYMLDLGPHVHHGIDDVGTQFAAWRPLLHVLRLHYYG